MNWAELEELLTNTGDSVQNAELRVPRWYTAAIRADAGYTSPASEVQVALFSGGK